MKLFLLKRKSEKGWDIALGYVIAAIDETTARVHAAKGEDDSYVSDVWTDSEFSTCMMIAKNTTAPEGVVLRDFKAG